MVAAAIAPLPRPCYEQPMEHGRHRRCRCRRLVQVVVSLLAAGLSLLVTAGARAELAAIWAVDDGTKVKAEVLDHPLKGANGVFKPEPATVELFGMRNETVAFQLILQGGRQPTAGVRPRLEAVGPIRNAADMSDEPDRYLVGRRIELFAQHYLRIVQRSRGSIAWEPWTAAQPRGLDGWVPDALVPLVRGKRTVTVAAGRNQGIWVDLYIPKDTDPGIHRGKLTVEIDGEPCDLAGCTIAVKLRVLQQTMADRASTRTMLYFSGGDDDRDTMAARYLAKPWDAPDAPVEALRARHFKLLRRHRVTGVIGRDKKPTEALRRRLDGRAFGRAAGYQGPGEGLGQDVYSIYTYGGVELAPAQARSWHDWFEQHAPKVPRFFYAIDEPGVEDYPKANRLAARAKPLDTFITAAFTPSLRADIFCALTDQYSISKAKAAREAGKRMWVYNGTRPFAGSFMIDDVAVAPRVNPWIQYKYRIERWFYWEATYYRDFQGGRKQIDVFAEPNNFRNADGDRLNGDGLLVYPGRDRIFPAQDRGLDMPLPSIRLKNWRRGIEDVEYLVAASAAGHRAYVERLLAVLVPRALADEMQADEPVAWPEDGEKWLEARRELARLLRTGKAEPIDAEKLAAPAEPRLRRLKREAIAMARRIGKPTLLAVGGFVVLVLVALVGWRLHRRRTRRREQTFE